MKTKSLYSAAVVIALVFSGPLVAGGGGGGGMGTGGSGHRMDGGMGQGMGQGQGTAAERRSDKALQQDRDRETYRGPDAERNKQK
ncbi:MAG: hypothetical protein PVH86_11310, partial [Thiogranum sp.]